MSDTCSHLENIKPVTPSARGCEDFLKTGSPWLHLRICRSRGHGGCCDDSPNQHATAHYHATRHPVIEAYDPPEGWAWCNEDELAIDLGENTTAQDGPIPRFDSREDAKRTQRKHHLSFPLLSDAGNAVSDAFGLRMSIAPLLPIYQKHGIDLPTDCNRLDVLYPATFIIRRDGVLHRSFIEQYPQKRMDPVDIAASVRELKD